jgi:hypothetical protein
VCVCVCVCARACACMRDAHVGRIYSFSLMFVAIYYLQKWFHFLIMWASFVLTMRDSLILVLDLVRMVILKAPSVF